MFYLKAIFLEGFIIKYRAVMTLKNEPFAFIDDVLGFGSFLHPNCDNVFPLVSVVALCFHQAIWFSFLITYSGENLGCPCDNVSLRSVWLPDLFIKQFGLFF